MLANPSFRTYFMGYNRDSDWAWQYLDSNLTSRHCPSDSQPGRCGQRSPPSFSSGLRGALTLSSQVSEIFQILPTQFGNLVLFMNLVVQVKVRLIKIIGKIKSVLWKCKEGNNWFMVHCNQNYAARMHYCILEMMMRCKIAPLEMFPIKIEWQLAPACNCKVFKQDWCLSRWEGGL